jgi:hypothetical protein
LTKEAAARYQFQESHLRGEGVNIVAAFVEIVFLLSSSRLQPTPPGRSSYFLFFSSGKLCKSGTAWKVRARNEIEESHY